MMSEGVNLQMQNGVLHHVLIDGCKQELHSQLDSIFIHSFVVLNFSHKNFGM